MAGTAGRAPAGQRGAAGSAEQPRQELTARAGDDRGRRGDRSDVEIDMMDVHLSQPGRNDDVRRWFLPARITHDPLPGRGRHPRCRGREGSSGLPDIRDQGSR
jgi:hypothetical protein